MSSSRSPNNDNVQYPALPDTLAGTSNDNAVTNNNAQGSMNDALARRPNNNTNDNSNNITSESSNNIAN